MNVSADIMFIQLSSCNLAGAFEGLVDVGTDVLLTEHRVETGLMKDGLHFLIDARKYNLDALGL